MDSQDSSLPSEPRNPITVGPERCNTAEAQDRDFKITIRNMVKDLKEDVNKFFSADCDNTKKQLNEIMKTVQDTKVEIESLS